MALADRTFSFRAPAALADRLRDAERAYAQLALEPAVAAQISRELEIGLQRRLRRAAERSVQGQVLRAVTEAFVEAVERAMGESEAVEELRAFDLDDRAGDAERRALIRASTLGRDT